MPEFNLTPKEEKKLLLGTLLNSPFTTIIGTVLTTFIIAALFFKFGGPVPISVTQTTVEKLSTFDVSGEGSVEVAPDVAKANFGITVSRNTVDSAQGQANEVLNNLKKSLKSLGVEEKDIKTTAYNISPDFSFEEGRGRIIGYRVDANTEVTFRDFEKLNQAMDAAVSAGANLVGGLSFELSPEERTKAEDEARKKAIGQARQKAEKIAREAGVTLGKVINVQERSVSEPPIVRPLALEERTEPEKPATEVSPGVSEIIVHITLSFETR